MVAKHLMIFVMILALLTVAGCRTTETPVVQEEVPTEEPVGEGSKPVDEKPVYEGPEQLVTITLHEWGLSMDKKTVNAGKIKFIITNNGPRLPHAFKIISKENNVEKAVSVNLDEVETMELVLEPGTYDIFCPLSGHKEKGIGNTLVVK
mgnify:CR=1 FL=1